VRNTDSILASVVTSYDFCNTIGTIHSPPNVGGTQLGSLILDRLALAACRATRERSAFGSDAALATPPFWPPRYGFGIAPVLNLVPHLARGDVSNELRQGEGIAGTFQELTGLVHNPLALGNLLFALAQLALGLAHQTSASLNVALCLFPKIVLHYDIVRPGRN